MNTWFKLPPRRLHGNDVEHNRNKGTRNQIDYIIINQRYGNALKDTRTYSTEKELFGTILNNIKDTLLTQSPCTLKSHQIGRRKSLTQY